MIITIDGPAGSGKSAAALELARRLDVPHLDTGAMYRAVALDALEQGILNDPDRIGHRCRLLAIEFDWRVRPATVLLNGNNVSDAIREPQVTEVTYQAADNPWVREELVKQQRSIGQRCGSLVTEGRDQGTIVFPGAEFKFYLNAHPEERARRRIAQLAAKGISAELSEVLEQILQRDMRDQTRAIGKLAPAKDAIDLDTTDLTLEQTVDAMLARIKVNKQDHMADRMAINKPVYTYRGEGSGAVQAFSWNAGRLFSRIISMLMFRLHVGGQAHLPRRGGALLVTNHQSFLDPCLVGIALPRQVHYMARDTLFKGGFLHRLMEMWNAFPVRRGAADLAAIRTAVERLNKGYLVNIFPEGTRSEDGTIGPIAPGLSLILNRCKEDVPVVPVVIDGAFGAWPRSAKFPRPHGIRIQYGRPIPAEEWRRSSPEELAVRVRRELVKLQREMGSPYAEASERRLAEEQRDVAKRATRHQRRREMVAKA